MYNCINIELQGVKQAIQSSCVVSTAPLIVGIVEPGYELAQIHHIVDMVKSRLRRAQEDTTQAT
jgi:hypothetical protein